MHISIPLNELANQKWEELNVLDKEEGPNLGNFALYSIILLDFYAHFVIAKIILFEVAYCLYCAFLKMKFLIEKWIKVPGIFRELLEFEFQKKLATQ